jgi:hypothetical protein
VNYPNQPPHGGPGQQGPAYGQYPPQQYGPPPGGQQQWPPQAQPAAPPKKRRKWPWIVLGVVAFIVLASIFSNNTSTNPVAGPSGAAPTSAESAPAPSGDTATVTYEIIGRSKASNVTFNTDGGGSISQENNVALPWRKEITVERGFAVTSLTAQNGGSGEITCRISVDGQVVKEAKSSGQYAVVSCAGEPIT